jgi:hypothetical protein
MPPTVARVAVPAKSCSQGTIGGDGNCHTVNALMMVDAQKRIGQQTSW